MNKKLLSLALLAGAWLPGTNAWAHDGDHTYVNGVCTIEGCTDKYQAPTRGSDGTYLLSNAGNIEWMGVKIANGEKNENNEAYNTRSYAMTCDIDYTGVNHTPIGPNDGKKFNGVFDGQHHKISNLRCEAKNSALFFWVRGGSVIRNLTIDETCSFTGTERAAAFICVTQVRTAGSVDIINCVNKATIQSGSFPAAAFVSTEASNDDRPTVNITNCVNFGAISSTGNKAASFIGNYTKESHINNSYNVGSLSPQDGASNFFRGSNRYAENVYELNETVLSNGGTQGKKTDWITSDPLHSGELCYLLNANGAGTVFRQTLDGTSVPLPAETGDIVYQNATYRCDGQPLGGASYSNTNESTIPPHGAFDENGLCEICGNYYQEPSINGGYYQIANAGNLAWFSQRVNAGNGSAKAKLTADIDMSCIPAFTPIGRNGKTFKGHFDGQYHTISNLTVKTTEDGTGLFGYVEGTADGDGTVIENLILDQTCYIEGKIGVGLVGYTTTGGKVLLRKLGMEGTVVNCNGGKNAGGIHGGNTGSKAKLTMEDCFMTGIVRGKNESAAISGWLGSNGPVVRRCWSTGTVESGVTSQEMYIMRWQNAWTDENNFSTKGNQHPIAESAVASGELCYKLNGDQSTIAWRQTLGVNATPTWDAESAQVYMHATLRCDGVAIGETIYDNTEGGNIIPPHNYNEQGICQSEGCTKPYQPATLTDGWYEIVNAGNLEFFSDVINKAGCKAINGKLTADIDMTSVVHTPIGKDTGNKMQGIFDGQGHRILNLTQCSQNDHVGLIGWLRGGATVRNVIIDKSCSFTGQNHVAGIAAGAQVVTEEYITIENCINEGRVHVNDNHAGGIYGKSADGGILIDIINCGNSGTITGDKNVVAIGSWMGNGSNCHVTNCWNTGLIVKSDWERGFKEGWQEEGHTVSELNLMNGGNINNVIITNTYDASASEIRTQGTLLDAEAATNGELAYKLNGDQSQITWYQTLGEDEYPVLDATHKVVEADALSISAAGYASVLPKLPFAVLPAGIKAYNIVGVKANGSTLDMQEVTELEAYKPVILEGYNNLLADAVVKKAQFYAPGWSGSWTADEETNENSFTLQLPTETELQWQAQFALKTNIATHSDEIYDFKATILSNTDINEATVKLVSHASSEDFYFTDRINLQAGVPYTFMRTGLTGKEYEALDFWFDFGGNPENTEVTISDLVFAQSGGIVYGNTTEAPADLSNGLLVGVTESTPAPVGSYVLQNQEGRVAFYRVAEGKQPTVGAHKAYLVLPAGSNVKALYFEDMDNETAIEGMETNSEKEGVIYNVAGQRISRMQKGVNIINGKKVLK